VAQRPLVSCGKSWLIQIDPVTGQHLSSNCANPQTCLTCNAQWTALLQSAALSERQPLKQ